MLVPSYCNICKQHKAIPGNHICNPIFQSNTGIEKVCKYCSKVIGIGQPMMWDKQEPYHEECFKVMGWDISIISPDMRKLLDSEVPTLSASYCYTQDHILPTFSNPISGFEPKPIRDSWNVYFIKLADLVSTRSTCSRKHCGAVITRKNRILSTGYNGSEPNSDHCDTVGHFIVDDHCVRTLHAERNSIKFCNENNIDLKGASIYINTFPCVNCVIEIIKNKISKIFYKDNYRNNEFIDTLLKTFNVKIEKVEI